MIPDVEDWKAIEFTASLPADQRDAVEALFFFNPRQRCLIEHIRLAVKETGAPQIFERNARVWVGVPSGSLQCLFAVKRELSGHEPVGLALYGRSDPEVLTIWHLAVHPRFGAGKNGSVGLGVLLVEKVREIGHRINGVRRLQLPYRKACYLPVGT